MALRMTAVEVMALTGRANPDTTAKAARSAKAAASRAAGVAWEREIANLLTRGGWVWQKAVTVRRPHGPGWWEAVEGTGGLPDFRCYHPARGLFVMAECKAGAAVCSKEQKAWIAAMQADGVRAVVWHDKDRREITRFILNQ